MRLQRWLLPLVVALAVLAGIAIAGLPKKEPSLHLKPLTSTTTTEPAAGSPSTQRTTTAPVSPTPGPTGLPGPSLSTTTTR